MDLFGTTENGPVHAVTIGEGRVRAKIMTLGASIIDLNVEGHSIVLGPDNLDDYLRYMTYFGAIVGRVSNRIAGAQGVIAGVSHTFDANEAAGNTLHGGSKGASDLIWSIEDHGPSHVRMCLTMPDEHMGFPGEILVVATYHVTADALTLDLSATTDKATVCAFAPHCYFDLSGQGDVSGHVMQIDAEHYLPLTQARVPTGAVRSVHGTRFDFRSPVAVGAAPIDHNFCLSAERDSTQRVAQISHPNCSFVLSVSTTEPGLQIYDAGHIPSGGIPGLGGRRYGPRAGIAVEPQSWPDAIHHAHFPSVVLMPGDTYNASSAFRFTPVS